jgi:hypothetical protein
MDNHHCPMIGTPEDNLFLGVRQLNGVYTRRFNRRHGRARATPGARGSTRATDALVPRAQWRFDPAIRLARARRMGVSHIARSSTSAGPNAFAA